MLDLLWAVAAILVVLWVLGFTMHVTTSALIHGLLVVAVIVVLLRVIMGRRLA